MEAGGDRPAGLDAATGLQVRLLGPVEVAADGQVVSPRPLLRVLLAVLALSGNRVVSGASLVEAMWQEEPSPAREQNLHAHVYQLRRLLADLGHGEASRLVTRDPGYQLKLAAHECDVGAFTALARQGRDAARAGDAGSAARLLGQALDLWRGNALDDAAGLSARLEADGAALNEQRLLVTEDLAQVRLALGLHRELAGELSALVMQHPLRERLSWLLMLALYRAGRQAEALERYQQARLMLADQLGIDPGPGLQELYQRILRADPTLFAADGEDHRSRVRPSAAGAAGPEAQPDTRAGDGVDAPAAAAAERAPGSPLTVPQQLPAALRCFAGREAELKQLDELLGRSTPAGTVLITAIGGSGGIGKTTLALHWAHRVAGQFPDGQLHVNLRGFDPSGSPLRPDQVLPGFLEAVGVPADQLPHDPEAQAGLYRSLMAGRRMLIVLDNAADAKQVRPLLPAAPGCLVIVTSRSPLTGLVTTDGAVPVRLDAVTDDEAVQILAARLGPERVAREPTAAQSLASQCGRLPLALAVAAARSAANPDLSLAVVAGQMAAEGDLLDALETEEDTTSVRAVFSWSYGQLSESAARMFRMLGLHCGPDITIEAAASLAAVSPAQARACIAEHIAAGLVVEHVPGRYTLHDLLRAFAIRQARELESEEEQNAAVRRCADHYLHSIDAARAITKPLRLYLVPLGPPAEGTRPQAFASLDAGLQWQRAERQVLLSAVVQAAAAGLDAHAWQLARQVGVLLSEDGRVADSHAMGEVAVAAADRTGDIAGICLTYINCASDDLNLGDNDTAFRHIQHAVELADSTSDLLLRAIAYYNMTICYWHMDKFAAALPWAELSLDLYRQADSRYGEATMISLIGEVRASLGDTDAAVRQFRQAAEIFTQIGAHEYTAQCWFEIGNVQLETGEYGAAAATLRAAEQWCSGLVRAMVLEALGQALDKCGDQAGARAAWLQGLATLQGHDYQRADHIRAQIEQELAGVPEASS